MIELNDTAYALFEYSLKREANGANIKVTTPALLKHCATEVVEATDAYRGFEDMEKDVNAKQAFADELSDVVACVLIIAANEGIDMEDALHRNVTRNRRRAMRQGDKL